MNKDKKDAIFKELLEKKRKSNKLSLIEKHISEVLVISKDLIRITGNKDKVIKSVNEEIIESVKYIFNEEITIDREENDKKIKHTYSCMGHKLVGYVIGENPNYNEEMGNFLNSLKDILNNDEDIKSKVEKIKNL